MDRARRIAAIGILLMFPAFCGQGEAPVAENRPQAEAVTAEGLIVALGDSLTAGLGVSDEEAWPALLEEQLRADGHEWKVINAGISGETSSGARSRIGWILKLEPEIIILETGANDGLRGLPTAILRENLDAILKELNEADVTVVLAGMRMVTNLGADYTAEFAQVYADMAMKHGVLFIPFILEGVAGDPDLNQADGIHPTAEGHKVLAGNVYPKVVEAIGMLMEGDGS